MSDEERDRWNQRWGSLAAEDLSPPSSFLVALDDVLPRSGRALDVAGGAGHNAVWLARRGLDTTLLDISDAALALSARYLLAEGELAGLLPTLDVVQHVEGWTDEGVHLARFVGRRSW